MKRLIVISAISMMLCSMASAQAYVQEPIMGTGRYVAGGVTSLLGFGIGHAVQGRYAERGWIFTAGEVLSVGLFGGGFAWMAGNVISNAQSVHHGAIGTNPELGAPVGMMVAGGVTFIGFKIWEIVDAWTAPLSQAPYYAAADRPVSTTKLAVAPYFSSNAFGLVMQY
jgi:hypothetical protein